MNNLLNLNPARNFCNLHALRKLYINCEENIRNLNNLCGSSTSHGHLLTPILLKVLPQDLIIEIKRKCGEKNYSYVNELIYFIKNEIEC